MRDKNAQNATRKMRIDKVLPLLKHTSTRTKAQDLVRGGHVFVNGRIVEKPHARISPQDTVTVSNIDPLKAPYWVSRAAVKLYGAIKVFQPPIEDRICLDVGAGAGGFTQVLLWHKARRVYAVDVGHNQLHPLVRENPKVVVMERTDARTLKPRDVVPLDAFVVDASFIELQKVLSAPLRLVRPEGWVIALIKPQFQVGGDHVTDKGIVIDTESVEKCIADVAKFFCGCGWRVLGVEASPIKGRCGNQEYLMYGKKSTKK